MSALHADELSVGLPLVRQLVDRQFPEYGNLDLRPTTDSGSSNALFRLGSDKLVRLPRQPGGGTTIDKESAWLPLVATHVSVEVPAIVGTGEPDLGYPERWAITTWIPGSRPVVSRAKPAASGTGPLALDLARFLTELRTMEVPDTDERDDALVSYRGLPLGELDAEFRESASTCRSLAIGVDIDEALRVWDEAIEELSATDSPEDVWLHGDLLAENVLVDEAGRLAAVVDFGGLALGNPTVDLVVAWEVLDARGRKVFRRALDIDDRTWTVSRGWALLIAMITFPYYHASMPARCVDRLTMALAAIEDAE